MSRAANYPQGGTNESVGSPIPFGEGHSVRFAGAHDYGERGKCMGKLSTRRVSENSQRQGAYTQRRS